MDCVICKNGMTHPGGEAAHTFTLGTTVAVVREIPADVCDNCGEPYFSSEVAKTLERLVDNAVRKGTEMHVLRYAA